MFRPIERRFRQARKLNQIAFRKDKLVRPVRRIEFVQQRVVQNPRARRVPLLNRLAMLI